MQHKIAIILFFIFSFLAIQTSSAQPKSKLKLVIFGKIKIEDGNTDDVKIAIQQVHGKIKKAKPDASGKFEFKLDYFEKYIISFSKKGYRTKKISVDTHVPENLLSEGYEDYKFNVTLMADAEDGNTSYYAQPVGAIIYDGGKDDFTFDTNYDLVIDTKLQAEIDEKGDDTENDIDGDRTKLAENTNSNTSPEKTKPNNSTIVEPDATTKKANEDPNADNTKNDIDGDRNKLKIDNNSKDNSNTENDIDGDRNKIKVITPETKEPEKVVKTNNDNDSNRTKIEPETKIAVSTEDSNRRTNKDAQANAENASPRITSSKAKIKNTEKEEAHEDGETQLRYEDAEKLYPPGITVEYYKYPNKKIKKIIINRENSIVEYKIVTYNWGGIYYFQNNKSVSQIFLSLETKARPGEETRTEFK